jgi:hypothetical protein
MRSSLSLSTASCPRRSACRFFVCDVAQAVLETGDLAEPLHLVGFAEPFPGVDLDLDESWKLGGIGSEHGATDAPLTELAPAFEQVTACFQCEVASLAA